MYRPRVLSSPGLTGRSSNHGWGVLDCPVKPGNDTGGSVVLVFVYDATGSFALMLERLT
jgi:hypothetical protein